MSEHFFLIGAMKSGTSCLYRGLRQHPDICMSNTSEPCFFELDSEYMKGEQFYLDSYFPHHKDEVRLGEARNHNMFFPWATERIETMFPGSKYLVLLRDPVDRAYSHYWHWRRDAVENNSFADAIYKDYRRIKAGKTYDQEREKEIYQQRFNNKRGPYRCYLDMGYYDEQLENVFKHVPRDRVKIVTFRDFVNDTLGICNEIFEFLGIDRLDNIEVINTKGRVFRSNDFQRWIDGIYRKRKKKSLPHFLIPHKFLKLLTRLNEQPKSSDMMNGIIREWLYNHYKPHNERLNELITADLDHWTFEEPSCAWKSGFHPEL